MTEQGSNFPQNPEQAPLPEGFIVPSDSVLKTDVVKDYYEAGFIHKLIRTPDQPEELHTPPQKNFHLKMKFAQLKMLLVSPDYDPQLLCDYLNFDEFLKEEAQYHGDDEEDGSNGYQLEHGVRQIIVDLGDVSKPLFPKARRAMIKRYTESKKLAEERQIPEEDVFADQDAYRLLMIRSTSPEDVISSSKEALEIMDKITHILRRDSYRTATLMRFAEQPDVSLDDIEDLVTSRMDSTYAREKSYEAFTSLEEYLDVFNLAFIERYWGKDTAALFE